MISGVVMAACAAAALGGVPAEAQTRGKGGTMVNEAMDLPRCSAPVGTVALVEAKKQVNASGQLSPGLQAFLQMARAQQGLSTAVADPIPLLRLIMAKSGCFQVLDRGEGFDALQRERALASSGQVAGSAAAATLVPADYLLTAEVVYQDENAGSRGGALGGLGGGLGGLVGVKQKKLETQTLLTLTSVKKGTQEAIASGSARKRDLKVIGGGLAGLGLGLAGGNESTDIAKVTSAALLDAYSKLVPQVEAVKKAQPIASEVSATSPSVSAPQ